VQQKAPVMTSAISGYHGRAEVRRSKPGFSAITTIFFLGIKNRNIFH
jgi:hypothetical protein